MSKYATSATLPAPVARVVQAAAHAAPAAGLQVQSVAPYALKCRPGITLTTYAATVELSVAGTVQILQSWERQGGQGNPPPAPRK
jgi:hypothetical protein